MMGWKRPWVPLIALLVAAVVGTLGASGAPRYAASTTLVVAIVDSASGLPDSVAALASARAALDTVPVTADVANRAEVPVERVADAVSLREAGSGALAVTAVGDSPESAARLAAGARDAVAAAENTSTATAVTATIDGLNTRLIDVQLRVLEWSRAQGVPSGLLAERDELVRAIARLQATPPLLRPGPDPVAALVPPGALALPDAAVGFLAALALFAVGAPLYRSVSRRRRETPAGGFVERGPGPPRTPPADEPTIGSTWPYDGLAVAKHRTRRDETPDSP